MKKPAEAGFWLDYRRGVTSFSPGPPVVGDLDHALKAAGHRAVGVVLARNAERRRAFDMVGLLDLHRAAHLAGDAKGLVGFLELGAVDALLGDPGKQHFGFVQALALGLQRLEHLGVHLVERGRAHGLQRVVDALQRLEAALKAHVHHAHRHILGRRLLPGLEGRLEVLAVRAAVREELDHLDLPRRRIDRRALLQRHIARPRLGVGRQGQQAGHSDKGSAQGEFTTFHKLKNPL